MPYKDKTIQKIKHQEYALAHKEKIAAYSHAWYLKNKKKHRAYSNQWYKNNPDKVKAIRKRRLDKFRTDPSHHYSSLLYRYKHGTNKRKIEVIITREEFVEWYNSQVKECFYCGITREQMLESVDSYLKVAKKLGIDRMDDNLPYQKGNLALACHRCNSIKNNFFTSQEMKEIAERYIKPRLNMN